VIRRRWLALSLAVAVAAVAVTVVAVGARPADSQSETRSDFFATTPSAGDRDVAFRQASQESGFDVRVPWLPAGFEVTGIRTSTGPGVIRLHTAEVSLRGPAGAFVLEQNDRPASFPGAEMLKGAAAGAEFTRASTGDGGSAYGLSNGSRSAVILVGPGQVLDSDIALRILTSVTSP